MEQQLGMLEARLVRREQELTRVLDESKASGHLERLRLQNIHEQVRSRMVYILKSRVNEITFVFVGNERKR